MQGRNERKAFSGAGALADGHGASVSSAFGMIMQFAQKHTALFYSIVSYRHHFIFDDGFKERKEEQA